MVGNNLSFETLHSFKTLSKPRFFKTILVFLRAQKKIVKQTNRFFSNLKKFLVAVQFYFARSMEHLCMLTQPKIGNPLGAPANHRTARMHGQRLPRARFLIELTTWFHEFSKYEFMNIFTIMFLVAVQFYFARSMEHLCMLTQPKIGNPLGAPANHRTARVHGQRLARARPLIELTTCFNEFYDYESMNIFTKFFFSCCPILFHKVDGTFVHADVAKDWQSTWCPRQSQDSPRAWSKARPRPTFNRAHNMF